MKAVFNPDFVQYIRENVKKEKTKMDEAKALMADIENFKKENNLDRAVMIWCASTRSIYRTQRSFIFPLKNFGKGTGKKTILALPQFILCLCGYQKRVLSVNGAPINSGNLGFWVETRGGFGFDFRALRGVHLFPPIGLGSPNRGGIYWGFRGISGAQESIEAIFNGGRFGSGRG